MAQSRKVPAFDEMMWPTLEALKASGGSASNQELFTKVAHIMNLPDETQNVPHGNGPRTEVEYRLLWARTYLRKVGAIDSSQRGVWSITPAGRALTEADMKKIVPQVKEMYAKSGPGPAGGVAELPASDQSEENWRDQLLSVLQAMPADAFERLAQRILRESGFVEVEVKGQSGDGGIDGVGVLRVNPLLSLQVSFQCKRYKGVVAAGAIRDFRGAMAGRTGTGLFITSGRFTPDAKRESAKAGAPPIDLIDGAQLCDLLKTLNLGLKKEMVEHVTVVPEAFKEFEVSKQ